ncbi:MAG: PilT/PilU family type 4a pilus ATPase [Nitrospirae bacterium]|nr:PilT/PilU family type 4a pilus ATPase [Nitrospirota bacterium]
MGKEEKKQTKARFGEILLEHGIITSEQLRNALRKQDQIGGLLGSILETMGYIDEKTLVNFLGRHFNMPSINLFEVIIEPAVLNLFPFKKVKAFKVLPVKEFKGVVTLAMVNPHNISSLQEVEFVISQRVEPAVVPFYQMEMAIAYFEKKGYGDSAFDGSQMREKVQLSEVPVASAIPDVKALLKITLERKASDLFITAGVAPAIRVDSDIERLQMPVVTPGKAKELAYDILNEEQRRIFEDKNEIDLAISLNEQARFRVNIYRQRNSVSIAARLLEDKIPSLKELSLPAWLSEFALKEQGFILITGPSGHGKSTTMASLIDIINANRRSNIITIEDPIEFFHKHKKSNINQREIGEDTESFAVGLRHIFRQNPDVIVIGEMRDYESISIALTAAETGHLVLSTMHTLNTTTAIDRIIDIFPGNQQNQVRLQFADAFLLVISQRLITRKGGKGLVVAVEKLVNTHRIRNLIRESKTHSIRTVLQASLDDFMSIDHDLARLCLADEISFEDGLKHADNQQYYQDLVKKHA